MNRVPCTIAFLATLHAGAAFAQFDPALSAEELIAPWTAALAVLQSIVPSLAALERGQREQLDSQLARLDQDLNLFQSREETVATRIVADPAFAYAASDESYELSQQLSGISEDFAGLWAALQIAERTDVRAAGESLELLQRRLRERNHFERDVVRALGSGGRQEILELSTRWWKAADSVEKVRGTNAELRTRRAGI